MKSRILVLVCGLLLGACATAPRNYVPPDSAKLRASTARVSKAVDSAHASARAAKAKVDEARLRQKEISTEVKKLKDVPPELIAKIDAQDATLGEAGVHQEALETHLTEADKAKADVEKDKTDYFAKAQKLADDATKDNHRSLAVEQEVNSGWGTGAFIYGFKRLAKHLIILGLVLIGLLAILLVASFFVPALGPVLSIATSAWSRFMGLFRSKKV